MAHRFLMTGLLSLILVTLASARVGVGIRCWITQPGRRAVVASRAFYELAIKPGESEQHVLEVSNPGDETGVFQLYPNDALNNEQGTLVGGSIRERPSAAGKWITLENARLQLGPEGVQRVAFRVDVPPDAPAGEHFGWVFVEPDTIPGASSSPAPSDEAQLGITLKQRIGVLIIVRVLGSQAYTSVLNADAAGLGKIYESGQIYFRLKLSNTGNSLCKSVYRWRLVNPSTGQAVAAQEAEQTAGYICPGHPLLLSLPLTAGKVLPRGTYQLNLEATDVRNPEIKTSASFPVSIP